MLLCVRFGEINGENLVFLGNFAVFSVSNGYTTLFNIFDNILSGKTTFSCFCHLFFLMRYFIKLFTIKVPQTRFW